VTQITDDMKINATIALANYVRNPTVDEIIPSPLDKNIA
jgi:malic enzyme